ncbi:MAG: hypothetical protein ABGW69_01755 [Nanoarchaeota archaeon]
MVKLIRLKKADIEIVMTILGIFLVGFTTLILSYSVLKNILTGTSALKAQELIEGIALSTKIGNFSFEMNKRINNLIIAQNGMKVDYVCLLFEKNEKERLNVQQLININHINYLSSIDKNFKYTKLGKTIGLSKILLEYRAKELLSKFLTKKNIVRGEFYVAATAPAALTTYYINKEIKKIIEKNQCLLVSPGKLVLFNNGYFALAISQNGTEGKKITYNLLQTKENDLIVNTIIIKLS